MASGDRRFRIEHAQHMAAKDFDRFAQLHVIASVQPYHAIDDGRWAEAASATTAPAAPMLSVLSWTMVCALPSAPIGT